MIRSEPCSWLEQPYEGYVVNAIFSDFNAKIITNALASLAENFPGVIYPMSARSLHVTLFDWIAPLFDYGGANKSELFNQVRVVYDQKLSNILNNQKQIEVTFDEIKVTPTTIIITGKDDGSFERIRKEFVNGVDLLPDTKLPPTIIHASIARFIKEVNLELIEDFFQEKKFYFEQLVTEFRLVHTKKEPMLDFEILKRYPLR